MARILGDGTRQRTQAFTHLQSHYLFRDRFGRPGKGKVEALVKTARRTFMVQIPKVADLDVLNERLLARRLEQLDALEQGEKAAALRGWKLDPAFDALRRLLEARFGPRGKRDYIQTLRLLEDFPENTVTAAVQDAVKCRLIGFDAVKHLLLARIEKRPARLDLSRYPHLPQPFIAATRSADYATLLVAGAGHG